jgi:integrase
MLTLEESMLARKLNPNNERLKRIYLRYVKEAKGRSEPTLDAIRKALARYEEYTGGRDFRSFNREQAIGFKQWLTASKGIRTGEPLSSSTRATTLAALREFFAWLSWQPGYKSKIHLPDVEYLSLSMKDAAIAKAGRLRDFPSVEQIRSVVAGMPDGTVLERRNRALVTFAILTGIRDRAMASLCLRHLDLTGTRPLVRQEPDRVKTKFSKYITTYFFPLGEDLDQIVVQWADELRVVHLFGPNDPLFPRTKVGRGNSREFNAMGIEPSHWATASPIRDIFRAAFEGAGLCYYPPHSFRHTLGHLMQTVCKTPEQIKAWSQNLGHEHIGTTLTSYGKIDPRRQGEIIGSTSLATNQEGNDVLARIRALVA